LGGVDEEEEEEDISIQTESVSAATGHITRRLAEYLVLVRTGVDKLVFFLK
jgi:hypothetical protein